MNKILEKIKSVDLVNTEDLIISQIRGLINSGELKPGDKLPPERILAEKFQVGRGYIRRALQKLEFYGIIKIHHQSGSFVSELGITILDGLLSNILTLEDADMKALVEARFMIEVETAGLAAERADQNTLNRLKSALDQYIIKVDQNHDAMEEDILFHIRIAECSGNPVLRSMIMVIAQDIIRQTRVIDGCKGGRTYQVIEEHKNILDAIDKGSISEAKQAMRIHLNNTKTSPESHV
ncbi:MAG: FadR/GntR family transcriptional regulator [Bacteroidales bacterium]